MDPVQADNQRSCCYVDFYASNHHLFLLEEVLSHKLQGEHWSWGREQKKKSRILFYLRDLKTQRGKSGGCRARYWCRIHQLLGSHKANPSDGVCRYTEGKHASQSQRLLFTAVIVCYNRVKKPVKMILLQMNWVYWREMKYVLHSVLLLSRRQRHRQLEMAWRWWLWCKMLFYGIERRKLNELDSWTAAFRRFYFNSACSQEASDWFS